MSLVDWIAIATLLIACATIWFNSRGTNKLLCTLKRLAMIQVELDLRREQLLSELQQAKYGYLADNHIAGYYKEAADFLKDQFERVEEPKLMAKMHKEFLEIQKSHLAKLKDLAKDLS